jgi:serine/threonine protein kinase
MGCSAAATTGHLPFEGEDKTEIKHAIGVGMMRPFSSALSPSCKSFLGAMLTRDARARPSARQLLQHPIVLAHTRPTAQHPLPAHTSAALLAPLSDSASSLDGNFAPPPRPAAMTSGAKQQPCSGAASIRCGFVHCYCGLSVHWICCLQHFH